MTASINYKDSIAITADEAKNIDLSAADHKEAILGTFSAMADCLNEGSTGKEAQQLLSQFKSALITAIIGNQATPTSFIPTPTSLIPGVPTPTSLIPTPVNLDETLTPAHKKEIKEKLFAWIRIYTLNALFTMPGTMLENSNAIQNYMNQGLNKLSEQVMQESESWSDYGQQMMSAIQASISILITKGDDPNAQKQLNSLTGQFNLQNTMYQSFLEKFSALNDGINQTTTTTTQTQTLNNQNISQGPLAMITMLTQCWSVIA